MESVKRHPVLQYSTNIVKYSSPLGLLGSYMEFENRISLKAIRGAGGVPFLFIIPYKETQSNRIVYFLSLFSSVFPKNSYVRQVLII